MKSSWRYGHPFCKALNRDGFTIIELMVGIAVSAIVIAGVYGTYATYTSSSKVSRQLNTMMQNLRGAVAMMEMDARVAGPAGSGTFGVTDTKNYTTPLDTAAAALDPAGSPVLTVAQDIDGDSTIDVTGNVGTAESVTYLLYDDGSNGILDFGVQETGFPATRVLIAEGIQAVGFAYAFDLDGDGKPDQTTAGGNTIWAIDADQDDLLDTALDSDDDGDIDANDAGTALVTNVPLNRIQMIRVWLLAQTTRRAAKCTQWAVPPVYVVANRQILDPNDCFRRRLLVRTIECKNLP